MNQSEPPQYGLAVWPTAWDADRFGVGCCCGGVGPAGDLKSANVLYDRALNIKLCDFAFSKFKEGLSAHMDSQVGTPAWARQRPLPCPPCDSSRWMRKRCNVQMRTLSSHGVRFISAARLGLVRAADGTRGAAWRRVHTELRRVRPPRRARLLFVARRRCGKFQRRAAAPRRPRSAWLSPQ